jgi:hypothetical protein
MNPQPTPDIEFFPLHRNALTLASRKWKIIKLLKNLE